VIGGRLNFFDLLYPPLRRLTGLGIAAIACYHGLRVPPRRPRPPSGHRHDHQGTFFVIIANTLLMVFN